MAGVNTGGIDSLQLSPDTAQRLAALIAADAQQLEERAGQQGVTAFLGRAVKRERPNERFLQNTLRNLTSANKRQEEKAMWTAWEAEQQQQQQQHRPHLSHSYGSDKSDRGASRRSDQKYSHGPRQDRVDHKRSYSHSRSPERRSKQCTELGRMTGSRRSQHSRTDTRHERGRSNSRSRQHASKGSELDAGKCQPDAALSTSSEPPAKERHDSGSAHSSDSWSDGAGGSAAAAAGDRQLLAWLADSKAVKGRGSIGPHADVAGPYLPPPTDDMQQQQGSVKGPAKPCWLKQPAADAEQRLRPNAAFLQGVLATQGIKRATMQHPGGAPAAAAPGAYGGGSAGSDGHGDSSDSSRRHKSSRKHKHKHGRSKTKKSKQHIGHKKHKHRKAHKQRSHDAR